MSKDTNNLEDFFRNSLSNYSENPSNDLWDRIEGNIPPKPSRKVRPAYLLLALLLFLLLGFGYEYFQFKNQMVAVNETVITQTEKLKKLKEELETVKGQLEVASQANINEEVTKVEKSKGPVTNSISVSTKKAANFKGKTPSRTSFNENLNSQKKDDASSAKENKTLIVPAEKHTKSFDFLSSKHTVIETGAPKLSLLALPKKQERKEISIEIVASGFRAFPNNAGNKSDKVQASNWKPSFDFGGLFNLGLNDHWDVQIGVGYSKMILNDAVYAELNYAREELDQSRGIYTSVYDYSVTTPSGEIIVNTLLSNQRINDGRDLEEGDAFKLGLQYQNELQYFQLPFFVRYKVGKGPFRFTVKSGFIQKFLLKENIKLSSVNPELDRLQNDKTDIYSDENLVRSTSLDVLVGVGGEYRISKRNSLHLSSNFVYSLQEVYPNTKPFSIGLQLGIQHKLGK